jgi:thymidylate kinase
LGHSSVKVEQPSPMLVSFSGVDGSGKSTQIANLCAHLEASGRHVVQLAFWDNVVVGTRYREQFVHKVYGSEKGIGAPGKPVKRNDKNVRKWYLSIARHGLYLLDALHLCEVVARARRGNPDVIVMDRYIYDELANLPLKHPLSRAFIRFIARLVPRPDVAFLLDADVEAAQARKPEYPLEFMIQCRDAYLMLERMLGTMTLIAPLSTEGARAAVVRAFEERAQRSSNPVMAGLDTAAA